MLRRSEVLCRYSRVAKLLLDSNQALVTTNNQVSYFNDGNELFESVFNEIRGAKRYIHMECSLFRNDELARRLVREPASKAKQGVEVKLLYDAFGGHALPRASSWKSLSLEERPQSSSHLCYGASIPGSTIAIIARS